MENITSFDTKLIGYLTDIIATYEDYYDKSVLEFLHKLGGFTVQDFLFNSCEETPPHTFIYKHPEIQPSLVPHIISQFSTDFLIENLYLLFAVNANQQYRSFSPLNVDSPEWKKNVEYKIFLKKFNALSSDNPFPDAFLGDSLCKDLVQELLKRKAFLPDNLSDEEVHTIASNLYFNDRIHFLLCLPDDKQADKLISKEFNALLIDYQEEANTLSKISLKNSSSTAFKSLILKVLRANSSIHGLSNTFLPESYISLNKVLDGLVDIIQTDPSPRNSITHITSNEQLRSILFAKNFRSNKFKGPVFDNHPHKKSLDTLLTNYKPKEILSLEKLERTPNQLKVSFNFFDYVAQRYPTLSSLNNADSLSFDALRNELAEFNQGFHESIELTLKSPFNFSLTFKSNQKIDQDFETYALELTSLILKKWSPNHSLLNLLRELDENTMYKDLDLNTAISSERKPVKKF